MDQTENVATQNFVDVAFGVLDKDAIFEILKAMLPKDVVSLYESSEELAQKISSENARFKLLMQKHFPEYPITTKLENVRKQYFDLANEITTKYFIEILHDNTNFLTQSGDAVELLHEFGDLAYLNTGPYHKGVYDDYPTFEIFGGNWLNPNQIVWLLIKEAEIDEFGDTQDGIAFFSREDAIDFVNISYRDVLRRDGFAQRNAPRVQYQLIQVRLLQREYNEQDEQMAIHQEDINERDLRAEYDSENDIGNDYSYDEDE